MTASNFHEIKLLVDEPENPVPYKKYQLKFIIPEQNQSNLKLVSAIDVMDIDGEEIQIDKGKEKDKKEEGISEIVLDTIYYLPYANKLNIEIKRQVFLSYFENNKENILKDISMQERNQD